MDFREIGIVVQNFGIEPASLRKIPRGNQNFSHYESDFAFAKADRQQFIKLIHRFSALAGRNQAPALA